MKKLGLVLQIGAIGLFVTTFFTKDHAKAVKRRWIALGIGAAGYAVEFIKHK